MKIIESILTKNPCYTAGRKITVKGLMLHSVGCPQPNASVFVRNWNKASYDRACVHAFIDGNTGEIYQCLPWNHRGWHGGGSSNNTHIGVEMCEPACIKYTGGSSFTCSDLATAKASAKKTYEAAVELFAMLCDEFKLNPLADGVIVSHAEGYKRGIASNHGDPTHLWNQLGMGYTMDGFRQAVKNAMKGTTASAPATSTGNSAEGIKVGDVVDFTGTKHYVNAAASVGLGCKPGKAKVTAIASGKKHPYHLVRVSGGGSTVYGWVDAADIVGATATPSTTPSAPSAPAAPKAIMVGDIVDFTGSKHYTNASASAGIGCKPGKAKVTAIYSKGKHPYHLVRVSGGGSTVYGWVDAADISGASVSTPASPAVSTPAPAKTIKVGSTVKLNKGAKTYEGKGLASFVYNRNHKVKEIKGDRVVITYAGVTIAAVKLSDLTLVS